MTNLLELKSQISGKEHDQALRMVYVSKEEINRQKKRIAKLLDSFAMLFGRDKNIELFSAPGRTEVGGNHTDHNHGRVLAAAGRVKLELNLCDVSSWKRGLVRIQFTLPRY
ncbi:MAG: galactokinase family protein [Eubacteriales bacterium]